MQHSSATKAWLPIHATQLCCPTSTRHGAAHTCYAALLPKLGCPYMLRSSAATKAWLPYMLLATETQRLRDATQQRSPCEDDHRNPLNVSSIKNHPAPSGEAGRRTERVVQRGMCSDHSHACTPRSSQRADRYDQYQTSSVKEQNVCMSIRSKARMCNE